MRYIIFLIFCITGFSASAQFWRSKPKPPVQEARPPLLEEVTNHPSINITVVINASDQYVHELQLSRANYILELTEDSVMTDAKHNMRFRVYNLASYNFSALAALYIQQNRFSEAKWYLLQSNTIAREMNDTKHLLDNLLTLAAIKIKIGELALAKLDLQEAHDIAVTKNMQADLTEIDKKIIYLQNNKIAAVKEEAHYAEEVEEANSKPRIN